MIRQSNLKKSCFLALTYSARSLKLIDCVRDALERQDYSVINFDDKHRKLSKITLLQEESRSQIASCDLVVADISGTNPNTWLEIGIAQAMGKQIIAIKNIAIKNIESRYRISFNLEETPVLEYSGEHLEDLHEDLRLILKRISELGGGIISPGVRSTVGLPFFVDWERIGARETENLCQELLAQMGYRHVQWGKNLKEIDLIAEYPRKDPDGFEYSELWLVSMGINAPVEMVLEEPAYFLERIIRYSSQLRESISSYASQPITFLVIAADRSSQKELDYLQKRFIKRSSSRKFGSYNVRLRLWDREYLTALIQRYPNIGFKYFSDEGRARAKTRKSFEELYTENNDLLGRQRKLNKDLKAERDKRVRAERDAVWKDISFSAAHKIGNPIFAIETGIKPLNKRILEGRPQEALEITGSIERSVDKAKAFVEQFKSLAKAQKIEQSVGKLQPLLLDTRKWIRDQGLDCTIRCRKELEVFADFERLAECFDELATNALRWLSKSKKDRSKWKIQIFAKLLDQKEIPDFLDQSNSYVVINFKDNGTGVALEKKESIFEAFVTEYEHGTGLGLALIRRIVEGHSGVIIEVGKPTKGADFEFYLPSKKTIK